MSSNDKSGSKYGGAKARITNDVNIKSTVRKNFSKSEKSSKKRGN